ncbi:MAG: arsenate reductase ArsC [Flavobacteriales bacterium]|nr:arsenate reductase ArsC [Flavobacteriales bacterium]
MKPEKMNILVLCTGNSCRSQMAEGYLRKYAGDRANIYSAGLLAHGLNSRAVRIMAEDGIDISGHSSNQLHEFSDVFFTYVITVCDHAAESCPVYPSGSIRIHQNFHDPSWTRGTDAEIMADFREVRDRIKDFCFQFTEVHL